MPKPHAVTFAVANVLLASETFGRRTGLINSSEIFKHGV